jgi:hypothetical protein
LATSQAQILDPDLQLYGLGFGIGSHSLF